MNREQVEKIVRTAIGGLRYRSHKDEVFDAVVTLATDALLAAVALTYEECAKVCESERVDAEATGDVGDIAYNAALRHAAEAIRQRSPK